MRRPRPWGYNDLNCPAGRIRRPLFGIGGPEMFPFPVGHSLSQTVPGPGQVNTRNRFLRCSALHKNPARSLQELIG